MGRIAAVTWRGVGGGVGWGARNRIRPIYKRHQTKIHRRTDYARKNMSYKNNCRVSAAAAAAATAKNRTS